MSSNNFHPAQPRDITIVGHEPDYLHRADERGPDGYFPDDRNGEMNARENFGVDVVIAAADRCAGDCLLNVADPCVRWCEAPGLTSAGSSL